MEIWINPACSKCAAATQALDEAGVSYTVRRYLDDPPTAAELDAVLVRLNLDPWHVVRHNEPEAAALTDLPRDDDHRADWLAAMVAHPILIQRPHPDRRRRHKSLPRPRGLSSNGFQTSDSTGPSDASAKAAWGALPTRTDLPNSPNRFGERSTPGRHFGLGSAACLNRFVGFPELVWGVLRARIGLSTSPLSWLSEHRCWDQSRSVPGGAARGELSRSCQSFWRRAKASCNSSSFLQKAQRTRGRPASLLS